MMMMTYLSIYSRNKTNNSSNSRNSNNKGNSSRIVVANKRVSYKNKISIKNKGKSSS